MKRCLSLALAMVMILSLFGGLYLPAEAASYSYNKGQREKVCTALSSAARSYYTGSYTYDQLSSLSGSSLRTKLRTLITSDRRTVGYDGLRTYFPYTDAYYANSSQLVLFYCNGTATGKWDSGKTWNREHMWPDSMGGNAMEGDLHSMRPTDPHLNSTRNNNLYGNASGGKTAVSNEANGSLPGGTYVSGIFEPYDFAKGDCARTILYDYVVTSSMSSVEIVFTDEETLLEWCALDPVDEFEMSRNDVAQEIQGCRNPFVDYPELAWILLGEKIPANMTTPSGGSDAVSYKITATSNNSAYGTVSLSGRTITATPKTGYYVEGYKVLLGSATVTREGNTFMVVPASDCTIRINFAKKTSVTVSFNGAASSVTTYAGEAITLPQGPAEDGYSFVGWTENTVAPTTDRPVYYAAGSSYIPNASVNLYPLYTYSEGSGGTGWNLLHTEADLYAGAQVILASNTKGVVAGTITSTYLSQISVTFPETECLDSVPEDAMIFTVGGEKGAWTLTNEEGKLLGVTSLKNLAWDSGTTTWDISIAEGVATIYSTNDSYGRILHNVTAKRFTTYTSNTSASMLLPQIYMNGGGVTYYTTELTACDHSRTTYTKAVDATCTEKGNVAYYTCRDCGKYFADASCTQLLTAAQLVIEAKGHTPGGYSYNEDSHWKTCILCGEAVTEEKSHDWDEGFVTVQPSETKDGVLTYTCETCTATYTEAIPALGAKLCLTFSVPDGVEAVDNLYGYKGDVVNLPEAVVAPEEGYTFVGWTLETVGNQTHPGTYYKAGQELTIEESLTFKALYKFTVAGEGGPGQWVLVTENAQIPDGAQVVLASNEKGTVAGDISSQYLVKETAEFSEDLTTILSLPESAMILTLGTDGGSRTLANSNGQLLGATALKKLAWDNGTTTWDITLDGENATIYNTKSTYGRFLYNVSSPRFTTYTSNVSASMRLPQLYVLTGGSTIYYTTEIAATENPTEPTVDPAITMGHTLNLASDISVNYAVRTTLLAGYDRYYLECVLPVYEGNTLSGSRTVTVEPVLNGSYYYFTLNGITAVNMNDIVTATLYMTKGKEVYVSNPDIYSIAQYAYSQLERTSTTEELKALCANLLRYGSAAQSYKGYRTDALADQDLTTAQRAYLTDLDSVSFGSYNRDLGDMASPAAVWAGKSLLLDSKVTVRYIFDLANYSGNVEELSLRVTYKNYKGEEVTATVTGGAQKYGTAEGRYSIDFDGLLAAELRTVLHAGLYHGEVRLSNTLEYSVATYGANKTGALGTLCRTLMAYSDTAKEYFN